MARFTAALTLFLAVAIAAAACSDDGGESSPASVPTSDAPSDETAGSAPPTSAPETTDPPVEPIDPPEEAPEFIELTYWEATERDTNSIIGGDDRCEQLDDETRRCESDLTFDSVATHLGRARDVSVIEATTYAEACPGTETPGNTLVLRGSITSQWGDEAFFKAGRDNCSPGARFWIIDGGTGRFQEASGVMSNTTTGHPVYSGFGTGQLSVRADLWEEWLPPAPATPPDPDVDYLDLSHFQLFLSTETTVQPDDQCDRSEPDVIVCTIEGRGELRGNYIGDSTEVSTGTQTQLLTEACELDDGSTGVPVRIETDGTITSRHGDELFFISRTHIDPCATLGSGSAGAVFYWRVTGGTGQFEGAHGLMSGVTTPGLGFPWISAGTLSVKADLWPELAAEHAKVPTGPDYIEMRYWERFLTGVEIDADECDESDPTLRICSYELGGNLTGTHIGAASEVQAGTTTHFVDETCEHTPDGPPRSEREAAGIITTPWGDDLEFRNNADSCSIEYWALDGGTGRFEGAGGVMSGLGTSQMGDDTAILQIGTFHLRTDLWDDLIPQPD